MVKKKSDKKIDKEVQKKLRHILYERAKRHSGNFQREFKKHVIVAITAALGFLIALSWREPISEFVGIIIERLGVGDQMIYYKFLSAIIITVIAVLALIIVSKWAIEKDSIGS